MILYGLVASDSDFAVDVFVSRESALEALAEVLFDEPDFAPLLSVVELSPQRPDELAHVEARWQ